MKKANVLGELERTDELWQLRFTRTLPHRPDKVWEAITQPEHLRHWFPDQIVVGKWEVGARLEFRHESSESVDFDGEVLACEPPSLLEFRWGTDTIRIEIAAHDSGAQLTLIDTIDEVGKAARDGAGWHVCLDALERELNGTSALWSAAEHWNDVHGDYIKKFGPAASTVGPPEGWDGTN